MLRVVVADLGSHRLIGVERDVGRVRDHQVDRSVQLRQGRRHVLDQQRDRRARQVAGCLAGGLLGQLDRMDRDAR